MELPNDSPGQARLGAERTVFCSPVLRQVSAVEAMSLMKRGGRASGSFDAMLALEAWFRFLFLLILLIVITVAATTTK